MAESTLDEFFVKLALKAEQKAELCQEFMRLVEKFERAYNVKPARYTFVRIKAGRTVEVHGEESFQVHTF